MNDNVCNICGANYEYRNGRLVCPACGAYKTEGLSDEEDALLFHAAQTLRLCDFDAAERQYASIIEKYPLTSDGYWGRALARFGIKYEEDFDGRKIPTCYAASLESFANDGDFKRALALADTEKKAYYLRQTDYIEHVRKEWVAKAKKEKPYDVFICCKDSDPVNSAERTNDSINVRELYVHLVTQGYRVFFSRESLHDKVGEKYEPYIFNALNTAKVMIVYGNRADNITSIRLKNEWTRYEKRLRAGEKNPNSLIVAYDGFNPAELPRTLSTKQCLNAASPDFYSDLDAVLSKMIRPEQKAGAMRPQQPVPQTAPATQAAPELQAAESPATPKEKKEKKKHKYLLPILLVTMVPILMVGTVLATKLFLQKTISFDQASAGKLQSLTVLSGEEYTLPHYAGTKNNYVFVGWSTTPDGAVTYADGDTIPAVTKDTMLYAVWEGVPLTVTLGTDDVAQQQEHNVKYGDTFTVPACSYTKTGYSFAGWADENGSRMQAGETCVVTESQRWLATWVPNENAIVFYANGGSGSMAYQNYRSGESVTLTKCTFFCTGYHFIGWALTPSGPVKYQDEAITETLEGQTANLYAVWEKNTFKINYVLNGGTNHAGNPGGYGNFSPTIQLNAPTRAGYQFKGWYADAEWQTERDAVLYGSEGDKTFYAAWEEIQYTVAFDSNDGTGTMDTMTIGVETPGTLPACSFTKPGYTFAGWSSETTGTVEYAAGDAIKAAVDNTGSVCYPATLYAVWKEMPHTEHVPMTDPAVAPTCTVPGKTEGSRCAVCGEVIVAQEVAEAPGHAPVTDAAAAATCLKAGKTKGSHCQRCGEVIVAQETIPPTGHTAVADNAVAPSCTKAGKTAGSHCAVCGTVIVAGNELPKINHTYNEVVVAATTTAKGYTEHTCVYCGDSYKDAWVDEVAEQNPLGTLSFTLNDDRNSYSVSGIGTCNNTNVVIPATYNSLAVTGIARKAFYECSQLVSVTIPSSVQTIGESAFDGCQSLMAITMQNSAVTIGNNAFAACDSGTGINFSGTTAQWYSAIGADASAYDRFTVYCSDNIIDEGDAVLFGSYPQFTTAPLSEKAAALFVDLQNNCYKVLSAYYEGNEGGIQYEALQKSLYVIDCLYDMEDIFENAYRALYEIKLDVAEGETDLAVITAEIREAKTAMQTLVNDTIAMWYSYSHNRAVYDAIIADAKRLIKAIESVNKTSDTRFYTTGSAFDLALTNLQNVIDNAGYDLGTYVVDATTATGAAFKAATAGAAITILPWRGAHALNIHHNYNAGASTWTAKDYTDACLYVNWCIANAKYALYIQWQNVNPFLAGNGGSAIDEQKYDAVVDAVARNLGISGDAVLNYFYADAIAVSPYNQWGIYSTNGLNQDDFVKLVAGRYYDEIRSIMVDALKSAVREDGEYPNPTSEFLAAADAEIVRAYNKAMEISWSSIADTVLAMSVPGLQNPTYEDKIEYYICEPLVAAIDQCYEKYVLAPQRVAMNKQKYQETLSKMVNYLCSTYMINSKYQYKTSQFLDAADDIIRDAYNEAAAVSWDSIKDTILAMNVPGTQNPSFSQQLDYYMTITYYEPALAEIDQWYEDNVLALFR